MRADSAPLTLATPPPGGGFSQYGETLASVLNRRAGCTLVQALPSQGTGENLTLRAQGRVDAALIQGTVGSEILSHPDADGLRILFAMYPSRGMLAMPAASRLQRLDEVRGRKVALGVRTSGLVTLGRQIFDGIGIDVDRDLQAIYVDKAAQSPELVLSGQAEGLWGGGGTPARLSGAGFAHFPDSEVPCVCRIPTKGVQAVKLS